MNNLALPILYEDEDILVINKPSGLIVHADGRTPEPSVSQWLVDHYPQSQNVGEKTENDRSGVVHRLDRDTSGALILAKTQKGFDTLKQQFQDREVEKIYYAFVYGDMKDDHGQINLPIGRSPSDFRKYSATRGARGEKRDALTYFQVIKRGEDNGEKWTLLELRPRTGRTHQIRVHMKALQKPVVGDDLYAADYKSILGFKRLALHARLVEFKDTQGVDHTVPAPFPEDFDRVLKINSISIK